MQLVKADAMQPAASSAPVRATDQQPPPLARAVDQLEGVGPEPWPEGRDLGLPVRRGDGVIALGGPRVGWCCTGRGGWAAVSPVWLDAEQPEEPIRRRNPGSRRAVRLMHSPRPAVHPIALPQAVRQPGATDRVVPAAANACGGHSMSLCNTCLRKVQRGHGGRPCEGKRNSPAGGHLAGCIA